MVEYQIFLAFLVGVLVGTCLVFLTQEDESDLLVVAEDRVRQQERQRDVRRRNQAL